MLGQPKCIEWTLKTHGASLRNLVSVPARAARLNALKFGYFLYDVPIPKKCILGTTRVLFLSENGRKQTKKEESRKHSTHRVLVVELPPNSSEPLEKRVNPKD
jgi:hypothetical protein